MKLNFRMLLTIFLLLILCSSFEFSNIRLRFKKNTFNENNLFNYLNYTELNSISFKENNLNVNTDKVISFQQSRYK